MEVEVSLCCNDIRWHDTDLCAACKEHADFVTWSDEGGHNDSPH